MAAYQTGQHDASDPDQHLYERRGSYVRKRPRSHSPSCIEENGDQQPYQGAQVEQAVKRPPPPSVEDEDASLAREKSPVPGQTRKEVISQGVVDQVPIMEKNGAPVHNAGRRQEPQDQAPTDTNRDDATTLQERRFVLLPKDVPSERSPRSEHHPTGSASVRRNAGALEDANEIQERSPRSYASSNSHQLSQSGSSLPPKVSYGAPSTFAEPSRSRPSSLSAKEQVANPLKVVGTPDSRQAQQGQSRSSSRNSALPHEHGHAAKMENAASPRVHESDRYPSASPQLRSQDEADLADDHASDRSVTNSNPASRSSSISRTDRRSQYSFSSADLKKINQTLEQTTDSPNLKASERSPRISRTPESAFPQKPWAGPNQNNELSSSTPSRSFFPPEASRYSRSSRSSRRASPMHSPFGTPPASPGREYGRQDWHTQASQGTSGRKSSRPTTPSMLSPPPASTFPAMVSNGSRSPTLAPQLPPRASTNPAGGTNFLQPNFTATASSQPQMEEVKRDPNSKPFVLRSRQTSPIPPPRPATNLPTQTFSNTAPANTPQPAASAKYSPQPTNTSRPRSRDGSSPLDSRVAQPPLPPRSPNLSVPGHSKTEQDRSSRSFEAPNRPSPNQERSATRSRSAQPKNSLQLPPCPRPQFVTGYNDWCTLPNHPNFDICPGCRKSLEDLGSAAKFIPNPKKPEKNIVKCDLSTPWVRKAWLLLLQSRPTHPRVVDQITTSLASELPCPGKYLAPRAWYGMYDFECSKFVPNFDACPSCVRQIEALFPNLKGTFHRTSSDPSKSRTCDLRADSRRFTQYIELLDNISQQAYDHRREPNMGRFVQLTRNLTSVRECQEDDQLLDQKWYFMPELPDFTVCEECYRDQVWPMIQQNAELANRFNRRPDYPRQGRIPISCQLYSARMRELWKVSCSSPNFEHFRTAAMQRAAKERDLQLRHAQIVNWPEEERLEEGARLVAEWRKWA